MQATVNMSEKRIDVIQLLRAIAALLVVFFHLQVSGADQGRQTVYDLFTNGKAGVDLFFVISGFIIYYTSQKRPGLTARKFIIARFWRIYPIYWFVLLIYVFVAMFVYLIPSSISINYELNFWRTINSFTLFPYPNEILPVAWTLAVEILFYGVFCLTFFKYGVKFFFAAMVVWSLAAQIYTILPFETPWLSFIGYHGVVEFLYGSIIAVLYLSGEKRGSTLALFVGLALFALYLTGVYENLGIHIAREWSVGIPSALILYGVLKFDWRMPKWVLLLGDSSYVLYLIHSMGISIGMKFFETVMGRSVFDSSWSMTALVIAIVMGACIVTVFVERPLMRWHKAQTKQSSKGLGYSFSR